MDKETVLIHAYAHWKKYIIGLLVLLVLIALVVVLSSIDGNDHPTKMVTVATYSDNQKVRVNENVLYGVGFLLFVLFSNIGRSCKCGDKSG
jgi:hypothetical protein